MTDRIHLPIPTVALLVLLSVFCLPSPASGQWSLEGRVGVALPSGELADEADQTAGPSFALEAMYTARPDITIYGGGSLQSFNCDGCPDDVRSMGVQGGVKFLFPAEGSLKPWVRGGILVHRADVDGDDANWGVGVDTGLGVDWIVHPRTAVVPAVRLNAYEADGLSLRYFTLDLGVHLHFGDF